MNLNSRLSTFFLVIGLTSVTSINCVQAQNNPPDTIKRKYCGTALLKRIPKLAEQTDSDPLLKAQDCSSEFAKSLVIKKDLKRPGVYIVSYGGGDASNTIIHLVMVNQNERYKIADVW
jgi:hypothetical protein